MEKKKYIIVQLVEAFGGGVYTYVKDLSNFLVTHQSEINCEIHLIYSPNRVELDKEIFQKEIHPDVFLYELDMQRQINLKKDQVVVKETRKILKKIKPDIIHLHSAKAGVIGRLASLGIVKKANVYYSPHGFSFVQQNISKAKVSLYKMIESIMPFLHGGTIIASGKTEFEIAKKIGKTKLIENGIDFEMPDKIHNYTENKRFKIGTVGRLTPQKNPKAFNEIASKLPNIDFVWIGNGELINEITSKNIKVTGWIRTREELLQKINSLDLYIQVSLWEGLPIAILEAMAMQKPLLVSNVIGNKDTVEDGYNGFVYNTTDEAIEKIKYFLEHTNLREMGEHSYKKAFKEYNKTNNFLKLIDIYKKVPK
ncbi:glycosyltransferase [Chryseobacterium sp. PBS4-4]|uniref:Glycosyltransferase n=1 Tax=Chryseobacterium edaphi TaxID=2976532 RepID=A0ABT2WBK9_9FLAO|nr:glycosyltransferase [Chryseobacterium edaphi]MCU7618677.1 glycosyltransferase [Chryseobacterium edaphi]